MGCFCYCFSTNFYKYKIIWDTYLMSGIFQTETARIETDDYDDDENPEGNSSFIDLPDSVPVVSSSITYREFFKSYLKRNIPCLIRNSADKWQSRSLWVNNGKPNFDYLEATYGDCEVTVYKCDETYYNSHKTEQCHLTEYLCYWKNYKPDQPVKYLKDWHLKNSRPDDEFYQVPVYFASDWLNEFLVDNREDDYRFVYMGPRNSWTPFHADVFTSYSWSANVCGKKRWVLLLPNEESELVDALGNFPSDISHKLAAVKHYDFLQNPGDVLFVPSGWYHQVWNLEDTISVNHNWINGCNVGAVWKSMDRNLGLVKKEIEDCRNMDNYFEHSQVMLSAVFGMGFSKFYEFLRHISVKRISSLADGDFSPVYNGHIVGKSHALFDLRKIKSVLLMIKEHEDFVSLLESEGKLKLTDLLDRISSVIKRYS